MKPAADRGPLWKRPELWVALCSALVVLVIGVVDTGRTSPGPLANPHASVPELAGRNECASCHGGWFQDMSSACLECHEAVGEHMESGRGLHGALAGDQRRCASCHSDHHGTNFQMVNGQSFNKAGVPDVQKFDHARVDFDMSGAHIELECTKCHDHAFDVVVPEGVTRFMGLTQRCASCHEDKHEGAFGRACDDCHVQDAFDVHVARGHEEYLPLVGGHSDVSCRVCHAAGDEHSLEAVAGVAPAPPERACLACHASPHGVAFADGSAQLAGLRLEAGCVVCHESEHTAFRDERIVLDAEQHATSGFPIALPHDGVDCAKCHDPALATFIERYPGRDRDACAACHEDPHGGQFASGPFAEEGCVACHGREHFEPHGFDAALHARTALPLEGQHLAADCNDCHAVPHEGEPREFRGTSDTCAACHGDAHTGFFDTRTAALEPVAHGDCARCHGATAFDELAPANFDHGRWTGFPIGGAHDAEGCESCHAPAPARNELGRLFGRVAPPHGALAPLHGGAEVGQACAACHQDPHAGRFDGLESLALVDGRTGCARCHTDASFRDLSVGFDHGRWTGFPLDGAHGRAACTDCHARLRSPDQLDRTWAPAKGANCAACHDDPHGAQFDIETSTGAIEPSNCARCHAGADTFTKLRFEHDWDSRFKLDATHSKLACNACHKPEVVNGDTTFRYKPLGMACTDCHGVGATTLRDR